MTNPHKDDSIIYCDMCCLQPNGTLKWPEDNTTPPVAIIDGPTKQGAWAYMCDRHLASIGYINSKLNTPVNTSRFNSIKQ